MTPHAELYDETICDAMTAIRNAHPGDICQQNRALFLFVAIIINIVHGESEDKPATLYPWDEAPEWANYAATNRSGARFWYENEPCHDNVHIGDWTTGGPQKFEAISSDDYNKWGEFTDIIRVPNWQDTLESRPKNKTPG